MASDLGLVNPSPAFVQVAEKMMGLLKQACGVLLQMLITLPLLLTAIAISCY